MNKENKDVKEEAEKKFYDDQGNEISKSKYKDMLKQQEKILRVKG